MLFSSSFKQWLCILQSTNHFRYLCCHFEFIGNTRNHSFGIVNCFFQSPMSTRCLLEQSSPWSWTCWKIEEDAAAAANRITKHRTFTPTPFSFSSVCNLIYRPENIKGGQFGLKLGRWKLEIAKSAASASAQCISLLSFEDSAASQFLQQAWVATSQQPLPVVNDVEWRQGNWDQQGNL